MELGRAIDIREDNVSSSLGERALLVCEEARRHADAGEFETARAVLGDFWETVGEQPRLEGLDERVKAEVLLRVGSLTGWIGSARQISGSQEIAKDLITQSDTIFEALGLIEKIVETRIDLATCYWREGAFDEARVTLNDALTRLGNLESEQRLRLLLNKAIVEKVSNRYEDALRLHREAAPLFDASSNDALKGKFHNEYAQVLKNIGLAERREAYIDQALIEFSAARLYFERAGHKRFLGRVENNEGFLFGRLGKFKEAHEHLDRARAIFVNLKDKGSVAEVDDTRARTFLREGRVAEADAVARGAVRILQDGDHRSLLVAVLTTQATGFARLGRSEEAFSELRRAIALAERAGDRDSAAVAALTIIEELDSYVPYPSLRQYYTKAESSLASSQDRGIQVRLGGCARRVLAAEGRLNQKIEVGDPKGFTINGQGREHLFTSGGSEKGSIACSLEEEVRSYEGGLIKQALEASGGSVTRAARLLGITHQGLAFILNGRHKDLLSVRTPIKPRRRSIIRYR